jgi:adenosylhomocysteinase
MRISSTFGQRCQEFGESSKGERLCHGIVGPVTDDQRHLYEILVGVVTVAVPAMFAEQFTVIRVEGHQRILVSVVQIVDQTLKEGVGMSYCVLVGVKQRRLEAMEADDMLSFPVYGVNDTPMKHYFDNVHGTGESSLSNVMITTNTMLSGKTVVIAGYGYCGRGIARKARGMGAQTIVTEVDPRKALEAHMDGHQLAPMAEAAREADYVITSTGNRDVVRGDHLEALSDGVILANAGHFDVEIMVADIEAAANRVTEPRDGVTRYHLPDGRRINVLADGRLVNLTGPHSNGHPAEVMDTTFAMMFEAARDMLAGEGRNLTPGLYAMPDRLDRAVANRKLETLDVEIDDLTEHQPDITEWSESGDERQIALGRPAEWDGEG